ncbi:MAG: twin-arginine translocase TatA/TatE family subunit [Methanocellales archaeon]|nr:twin-arginine translocase TatA/TatE family subunit [Methanocellales archaeon]
MIGPTETLLIFVIILLLFGTDKLPEMARAMGKAMGEFKKAQKEAEYELSEFQYSKRAAEKGEVDRIKRVAEELKIKTEGKTDDELLDEIQKELRKRAEEQNV